jgi:hypothetical protein
MAYESCHGRGLIHRRHVLASFYDAVNGGTSNTVMECGVGCLLVSTLRILGTIAMMR